MPAKPVLMIGHYPLDRLNSAPKLRIASLQRALAGQVELEFLTGTRAQRRRDLWSKMVRLLGSGYRFVYIEAATSASMEVDLLFLVLCWLRKVPVGIYIRDAYPMFGMVPLDSWKNRILVRAWFISIWFYQHFASVLFFPSASLAQYFKGPSQQLLPPGGRKELMPDLPPRPGPFRYLLHAGHIGPHTGHILLLEAMALLHRQRPEIRLLLLCEEATSTIPEAYRGAPWLVLRDGELGDILDFLPEVACGLVVRPLTDYNHLAVPVKCFDYMSLGLPIISTACREVADFLAVHQVGQVVPDTPEGWVEGICALLDQPELIKAMGARGWQLVQDRYSWEHRARELVATLTLPGR